MSVQALFPHRQTGIANVAILHAFSQLECQLVVFVMRRQVIAVCDCLELRVRVREIIIKA
jgi:hypothetical protein